MQTTLTVRLSEKEAQELQAVSELTGKSRSELVREALRAKLFAARLDTLRNVAVPRAREISWLSEEDVFRDLS